MTVTALAASVVLRKWVATLPASGVVFRGRADDLRVALVAFAVSARLLSFSSAVSLLDVLTDPWSLARSGLRWEDPEGFDYSAEAVGALIRPPAPTKAAKKKAQ